MVTCGAMVFVLVLVGVVMAVVIVALPVHTWKCSGGVEVKLGGCVESFLSG